MQCFHNSLSVIKLVYQTRKYTNYSWLGFVSIDQTNKLAVSRMVHVHETW